ncbi:MAG: glycosyltransferase family 39 protein [Bacteroidetes bacterium]|nr:glycosyltransferase family 39 protein [Bacteroidota bacterium]
MKIKPEVLIFFLALMAVFYFTGVFKTLPLRPQGIHVWGQTDRASVARNYAQEDMNFFLPRTHHTNDATGITGCEFPAVNYLAAICYKIFGFNEFWYRLIMTIFMAAGLMFAFMFSAKLLENPILACGVVLCWYLSPVLCYYTPNFFPDAASLGLTLIAWYFFFNYLESKSKKAILLWAIFSALAGLIKITSLISVVAIVCIIILDYFHFFRKSIIPNAGRFLLGVLCIFSAVAAWYLYANSITHKYWDSSYSPTVIFMLKINMANTWAEAREVLKVIREDWLFEYYNPAMWGVLVLSILPLLIFIKKVNRLLATITLLLYCGSLIFMVAFLNQFHDHDYYFIALMPAFLFHLILLMDLVKSAAGIKGISVAVATLALVIYSVSYAHKNNKKRYSGYKYDWHYDALQDIEPYLKSIGVEPSEKACVIYDFSFNVALYFANVKGWSMWPEPYHPQTYPADFPMKYNVKYFIVRDTDYLKKQGVSDYFGKKIGEHKGIEIYLAKNYKGN